ncbi:MAG: EamA family transporter, partial [Oceanospirillum sp.]|nr:EamA family transporter [Oceanospirillum sp.]
SEILTLIQLSAVGLIIIGIVLLSINIKEFIKLKKVNLFIGVKEGIIAMLGWGISLFLLVYPAKNLGWFLPAFIFRLFILFILAGYILYKNKQLISNSSKFPFILLILIGGLDIGGFFSYSFGVVNTNASIVAPVGSAFALVTVVLAKIFLKEKFTLIKTFGILTIISGLVLISRWETAPRAPEI